MPLYYRKSVRVGKHARINVSTRGVGVSFGIRGLRLGITPRGRAYIAGDRRGLYFKKLLSARKGA